MPKLSVDSRELRLYTARLEMATKTAFPISVRNALNFAARDMKMKGLIAEEFSDNFIVRRPMFIKSHSGFERIPFSVLDIKAMQSKAGIIRGKSKAGDQLAMQEEGGNVTRRNIPYADGGSSPVRGGGSTRNKIKPSQYFSKFRRKRLGIHTVNRNKRILKTRKAITLFQRGKDPITLYIYRASARIKKSPFVAPAGLKAGKNIDTYYIAEAKKRLKL